MKMIKQEKTNTYTITGITEGKLMLLRRILRAEADRSTSSMAMELFNLLNSILVIDEKLSEQESNVQDFTEENYFKQKLIGKVIESISSIESNPDTRENKIIFNLDDGSQVTYIE